MKLIDKYLPQYHFNEMHATAVAAGQGAVIAAVTRYQPQHDPFSRRMIALRELAMRARGINPLPFGLHNFTLLEQLDDCELAYGLIGRFWRSDFGLVPVPDGDAFLNFNTPGVAKLVLGFSALLQENGATRLATETRVFCPDLACRLKFAPYWYLIRPVSGLIRARMLTAIKKASESACQPSR